MQTRRYRVCHCKPEALEASLILTETLNLYLHNVHCKHIIFGASTDNSYASYLGSFHDVDIATRIRLLEGPPFAAEFKTILPRFKQLKFPEIFRSTKIDITQRQFSPMKKAAIDIPTRKAETSRYPTDTSAVSPALIDRLIGQKAPPSPAEKIFKQSLPDRTTQPSPSKLKFGLASDRSVSPTKSAPDTAGGGVSLGPRKHSNDNAALYRLASQVATQTRPCRQTRKSIRH